MGWEVSKNFTSTLDQPVIRKLSALFQKAEKELYVVGGSVRDYLLNQTHEDLDFATDAKPDEIIEIVKKWADGLWLVGIKFGTVGLVKGKTKIEITSLRSDFYSDTGRHPKVEFDTDILKDLSRRDFTINALAIKLPEGELLDPFNGERDLKKGVLRTPLSPEQSFSDDPLRMLRAVRFVATLGFKLDKKVKDSMQENCALLAAVSRERIRDELSKIVLGDNAVEGLRLMIDAGLTQEVVPELAKLNVGQDPNYHHKDVLEHTFMVVERTEPDIVLRLAALLHDVGKPACKRVLAERIVFYNHNNVGARMARQRLRSLKYPNQVINDVSKLITMHMRAYNYREGWTDKAVRKYVRDAGELLPKLNALIKADCTSLNPKKVKRALESLEELEQRIQRLEEEEESAKIRPPIDGNEVMAFLEIGPGRVIGEVLNMLLEEKLDGAISTKEEAYELVREWAEQRKKTEDGRLKKDRRGSK